MQTEFDNIEVQKIGMREGEDRNRLHHAAEVVDIFRRWDHKDRDDVAEEIKKYPIWYHAVWDKRKLIKIPWYLQEESFNHVSQVITDHGRAMSLQDAARNYFNYYDYLHKNYRVFTDKIDCFISYLENKEVFPPLIVVKSRIRKHCFLLDGVHRSLAIMAFTLKYPGRNRRIEVYIGYQWEIAARLRNMVSKKIPELPPVSDLFNPNS